MMIRKECLGQHFSKKSPHNANHFSGVITDNPEDFALYVALQLDVFEKDLPPIAEVLTQEKVVEVLTEMWTKDKPKKKKKNDLNESDE